MLDCKQQLYVDISYLDLHLETDNEVRLKTKL